MEDKDMKTALVQNWIQNIGTQIAEVIGSLDTSVGSSDGLPLGPPVWEDDERLQDFEKVYAQLVSAKAIVDAMAEKHGSKDLSMGLQ